jgi:alanine racemase
MLLAFAFSRRYNTGPAVMVSTISSKDRAWVEVNLDNVATNARSVLGAAHGARMLPMVKADAYGLGVEAVVRTLEPMDPWGYGVATVDEAIELRELGVRRSVVVFFPAFLDQLDTYRRFQLTAVLDRPEISQRWDLPYHLEIDTGMSRCGVHWESPDVAACDSEHLEGVFTHFHSADERAETVGVQLERFKKATFGFEPAVLRHVANSAGAFSVKEKMDLVRPGVFLYGSPTRKDLPAPLPVVSVRARVLSIRQVPSGESVSYGGDWVAVAQTTVATLGIGFADGLARSVAGHFGVLIGGVACPILGRVTMDMVMVDVSHLPLGAVEVGSVATILGRDGEAEIGLDDYARASGTSTYEVLVRLRLRLPRLYSEGA